MADLPLLSLPGLGLALLLLVLTVLSFVLSAMLERSGPIRLRHFAEEAGERLLRVYERPRRFETFRYLLSLLAKALPVAWLAALVLLSRAGRPGFGFAFGGALAIVGAVLAATEYMNRLLVLGNPERVLRRLTPVYNIVLIALWPLVVALAPLFPRRDLDQRTAETEDEASEDEIEAYLSVGAQEGILEPGEGDLIQRVIDFGDARVRQVMVPRIDMVCAPVETPIDELAGVFLDSSHSRIPLYRDSVDAIVGVLHIRDVMSALRGAAPASARELAHRPFFVPETKPLAQLLSEFQSLHQQMAIVVDEYGGTAGLVTVEDLLEEIVGEIVDEHDEVEASPAEHLGDGTWSVDGKAPLATLEELFDIELDGEPYETVGGLIFGLLGEVPAEGSELVARELRFTVERVADRRIQRLKVARQAPDDD